jgi:hypothetical protein
MATTALVRQVLSTALSLIESAVSYHRQAQEQDDAAAEEPTTTTPLPLAVQASPNGTGGGVTGALQWASDNYAAISAKVDVALRKVSGPISDSFDMFAEMGLQGLQLQYDGSAFVVDLSLKQERGSLTKFNNNLAKMKRTTKAKSTKKATINNEKMQAVFKTFLQESVKDGKIDQHYIASQVSCAIEAYSEDEIKKVKQALLRSDEKIKGWTGCSLTLADVQCSFFHQSAEPEKCDAEDSRKLYNQLSPFFPPAQLGTGKRVGLRIAVIAMLFIMLKLEGQVTERR